MISVIIPSARPERIPALEAALRDQDCKESLEIIIVTPRGGDRARLGDVRVVETDRLHAPGRMRNKGAAVASGEILFFIDDDCIPSPRWISALKAKLLESDENGAVGCRVVGTPKTFWAGCADYCLFSAYQLAREQKVDLGSAAIAVRRRAFEELSGFDETLLASEDWDFCLRMRAQGWLCIFDPSVSVQHDHRRASLSGILRQSFSSGFESGLEVQRRNYKQMSLPAKIAVTFASPWCYWLVALPYAALIAASQFAVALKRDAKALLYLPVIIISRFLYQCGVMKRLAKMESK